MNNRGEVTILVIILSAGVIWFAGFWIASKGVIAEPKELIDYSKIDNGQMSVQMSDRR